MRGFVGAEAVKELLQFWPHAFDLNEHLEAELFTRAGQPSSFANSR